jgi:rhamnosyl/mannosyltransferase
MKTVLHIGKFYPPVAGGMERVLETLCEATRGIVRNRVLVMHDAPATVDEELRGVAVTRVGTIGRAGSVDIAPMLALRLARERPDLVVFHEPNPWGLLAYALARRAAPLVVWYHSDVVRPRLQYALFYAPLAHAVYPRAAQFVVSSPALAEHAAPLSPYRSKVRVIPFGIQPREWPIGDGDEGFVFFAGRHVRYKGVDVLLEALRGTTMRAVIAGDGPMRSSWQRRAAELGVDGQAEFTGDISDARLRDLMRRCAVFVLPSVTRAEAFGYVQLEAMASGKPVVSTDVPSGVSWVNQHGRTGLVVPAGDAAALRDALRTLLSDADLRASFGRAGRSRVEETFTTEHLRDRLIALYAEHGLVARGQPC